MINMMRIKLDSRDSNRLKLLEALTKVTIGIFIAEIAVIGYIICKMTIMKNITITKTFIVMLALPFILSFVLEALGRITSRMATNMMCNILVRYLVGLPEEGRYNKIPEEEKEVLTNMTAEELSEKFREEVKKVVIEPPQIGSLIKEIIMWSIDQAKKNAKTGEEFVREYYTCIREICYGIFHTSETAFSEITGKGFIVIERTHQHT